MGSTRESASIHIYQDPCSYEHMLMPSASAPMMPLGDASARRNVIFQPPQRGMNSGYGSPIKHLHHSSSSPLRSSFSGQYNLIPAPQQVAAPHSTDSLVKKPISFDSPAVQEAGYTSKPLFTTFPSDPRPDKENVYHNGFNDAAEFPDPYFAQRTSLKRGLENMHEQPVKKARYEPSSQLFVPQAAVELPRPEDLPVLKDDDTVNKPPYSYAIIIGMAILRAPNRRLTLAQIYKWISDSFAYYRVRGVSWHNSIRHNLSLNKAFVKSERPKDDPGKGSYWVIEPGYELQFLKDRPARKAARVTNAAPLLVASFESDETVECLPYTAPPAPVREELSSDATIPASDALEEELEKSFDHDFVQPQQIMSSPPQMRSSPPVARQVAGPQGTPPSGLFMPSSVHNSGKRRKHYSMNDSGYISSLDSSVLRPSHSRPASSHGETELPKPKKRGRAEEEIARIRQMSHDSPSNGRVAQPSYRLPSSSPLRALGAMLPPHTPASRLQVPAKPPPSISPNSNLQAHRERVRELVGSPLRGMRCLEEVPWSPSDFDIHEDFSNAGLEVYNTFTSRAFDTPAASSPLKFLSSGKRPGLERAMTTGRFLAEVTGTNSADNSPIKGVKMPAGAADDDVFASLDIFTNANDDESTVKDEFGGLDILKGFRKIGGERSQIGKPRPALGRSSSNRV